jgi:hypothetical protein
VVCLEVCKQVTIEKLIWWSLYGTPPNELKLLKSGERNSIMLFILSEKYPDYMEQINSRIEPWRIRGWGNFYAIPSLCITHLDDEGIFITEETEAYNCNKIRKFNKIRKTIEFQ